jgi:hypothetical protein
VTVTAEIIHVVGAPLLGGDSCCGWGQRFENIGSRIDYTLTDRSFFDEFVKAAQPCTRGHGSVALDTGGCDASVDANSAFAALSAATLNGRWPVAPFEGPSRTRFEV